MRQSLAIILSFAGMLGCSPTTGSRTQQTDLRDSAAAPRGTPEWIVTHYFVSRTFPERSRFTAGEVSDGPTIGEGLRPGAVATIHRLRNESTAAAYRITIRYDGRTEDLYGYLEQRYGAWRLVAFRALALPRFYFMTLDSFATRPVPDSLATDIATMRQTVLPDSAHRAHFARHAAAFKALARDFQSSRAATVWDDAENRAPNEPGVALAPQLRALTIYSVRRDKATPGCVQFLIGGILDNSVGYLYAPTGCVVPTMSPDDFILVEQLEAEWYLFKTT